MECTKGRRQHSRRQTRDRYSIIERMRLAFARSLPNCCILVATFLIGSIHGLTTTTSPVAPRDWSWSDLEAIILPRTPPPRRIDYTLCGGGITETSTTTPVLYRERNGWCIYSARLWLALELKGIDYETILLDASRYDTYDGSVNENCPCPMELEERALPQFRFQGNLYCGSNEDSSLRLLQDLDGFFPNSPRLLWPGRDNATVYDTARAFGTIVSNHLEDARLSPRAAWLFCEEEGYRLDALPRSNFEAFLDDTESLLLSDEGGPFFGSSTIATAADIVWAPLLERYAAQLPCLHEGLVPRNNPRWPRLEEWYKAMDSVPEYACLVKGDAPSWRKVLFVDPWWPSEDLWHPRDTVGPKGELKVSEEECVVMFAGSSNIDLVHLWKEFAALRPHVCPNGPSSEAAAVLVRNHDAIAKDAAHWIKDNHDPALELDAIQDALKAIALLLFSKSDGGDDNGLWDVSGVSQVLAYLDHRICVPRDMGAPSAPVIRSLYHESRTK